MSTQRVVSVSHVAATVQCAECGHYQTVDRDEDGGAAIHQEKCALDTCEVQLCVNCARFECTGCSQIFCESHKTDLSGEWLCPGCLSVAKEEGEEIAR